MQGTGGFLHPEKIISQLDLQSGAKVADFGCGAGYFTILTAKAVGPDGLVYACDVLTAALEAVAGKARMAGLLNIKNIHCNLETPKSTGIPENTLDVVILANILFQSQKKAMILEEAKRVLKPQGKLIMIDWQPKASLAPQQGWSLTQNQGVELAEKAGFVLEKKIDVGKYHWGMILVKS